MLLIDARHHAARYGGYLLVMQYPICVLFIVTMMSAGVAGTTKKLAFTCAYQLGYSLGNIAGPFTFQARDAPDYYVSAPS